MNTDKIFILLLAFIFIVVTVGAFIEENQNYKHQIGCKQAGGGYVKVEGVWVCK